MHTGKEIDSDALRRRGPLPHMTAVNLHLFGLFRATRASAEGRSVPSGKAAALLAYLAVEPNAAHPRDALTRLLWPDLPETSARNNLRVTLARLKAAYDGAGPFVADRKTVRLDPDAGIHADVTEVEALLARIDAHPHEDRTTCPECRRRMRDIDALYVGDFLDPFHVDELPAFEAWQHETRERYRLALVDVLGDLAHGSEAVEDLASSERFTRRQIGLDPWREDAHRRLMRLQDAQGHRNGALAHFQAYREVLLAELATEPENETVELYLRLQSRPSADLPTRTDHPGRAPDLHNLSADATALVGRETELAELADHLRDHRLVTILGIGGVGKTRLAHAVAVSHLGRFAQGVFMVHLASVADAAAMPTAIAEAMSLRLEPRRDVRTQLLEHLRNAELMLVLDNFEHLLPGRSLIHEILASAPGVVVLVTSREQVGLSKEATYELRGLGVPRPEPLALVAASGATPEPSQYGSVELFLDRARRARLGFEPAQGDLEHIRNVCRLVEGHPLAIVLAASWVASHSCREIDRELATGIELLKTDLADVPERQRSIHAVFAHSWQALTPQERSAFARIAVFRGGFDRRSAQEVAGASLTLLASLVGKSLVRFLPDAERYVVHELMGQFARERLRRSGGEASARAAHAAYFLGALADGRNAPGLEGPDEARPQLHGDYENAAAAWRWAVEHDEIEQLSRAVSGLRRLVGLQNREYELFGLVEPILELADRAGRSLPSRFEAEILLALALAYRVTKGFMAPELGPIHARIHERSASVEDSPDLFASLYGLWSYQGMTGALVDAQEVTERWRSRLEQRPGWPGGPAFVQDGYLILLDCEGVTRYYRGEFEAAREPLEACAARYRRERHIPLMQTYGMDPGVFCRAWLAHVRWLLGHPLQGFATMDDAVDLARELGHPHSVGFVLQHDILLSAWAGRWDRVRMRCDQARDWAEANRLEFFAREAEIYRLLAHEPQSYDDDLARADAMFAAHAENAYKAAVAPVLVDGLCRARAFDRAAERADEALASIASLGFASHHAELLRLKGEARRAQGALAEAGDLFLRAYAVASDQGARMYALRAATSASRLEAEQGEAGHAKRLVRDLYERFAEGFSSPDLQAAQAEIARADPGIS